MDDEGAPLQLYRAFFTPARWRHCALPGLLAGAHWEKKDGAMRPDRYSFDLHYGYNECTRVW